MARARALPLPSVGFTTHGHSTAHNYTHSCVPPHDPVHPSLDSCVATLPSRLPSHSLPRTPAPSLYTLSREACLAGTHSGAMLFLAFSVLGAFEQCSYWKSSGGCTGYPRSCVAVFNETGAGGLKEFGTCVSLGATAQFWTCGADGLKIANHANQNCSDDVSAVVCDDLLYSNQTGCTWTIPFDACLEPFANAQYFYIKYTGSCPAPSPPPVLGAIEQSVYTSAGCTGTPGFRGPFPPGAGGGFGTCIVDDFGSARFVTCGADGIKIANHANQNCSDDVSAVECDSGDSIFSDQKGCSYTLPFDACLPLDDGSYIKLTGSCPAAPPSSPPYVFTTKASLQTAVRAFDANPTAATATYTAPSPTGTSRPSPT